MKNIIEVQVKIKYIVKNMENGVMKCTVFFEGNIDIQGRIINKVIINNVGFLLFNDLEELDSVVLRYNPTTREYYMILNSGFSVRCGLYSDIDKTVSILDFEEIHTRV